MGQTKVYNFSNYVPSLSDKNKAQQIYNEIMALSPNDNIIKVDLSGMIAMTTICARIIFGRLYVNLGQEVFYKNILLSNMEEPVKIVITWGIAKELENPTII